MDPSVSPPPPCASSDALSVSDGTPSTMGSYSAQDRKRYRKERRAQAKAQAATADTTNKGPGHDVQTDFADFSNILTTTQLLTSSLRAQLGKLAGAPADEAAEHARRMLNISADVVPSFKVGTLEMYKRFPEAYEALMDRHDCGALRDYLLKDVMHHLLASRTEQAEGKDDGPRSASSVPPFIRVADFGCGTGRIEAMVAQHPAVKSIYAYDGEAAMLPRCLLNTVKAAKLATAAAAGQAPRSGVRLLPSASLDDEANADTTSLLFPFSTDSQPSLADPEDRTLDVVARPCAFQSLQCGFLSSTRHAKCHLIVCAWSLSYLMRLQWGQTRWHAAVDAVLEEFKRTLDTETGDAAIVIIETLGSGTASPTRSNSLTQRLEDVHGFTKQWIRTDYTFANHDEATRMTRFFFGDRVVPSLQQQTSRLDNAAESPKEEAQPTVLMECTGMWTYWKHKGTS